MSDLFMKINGLPCIITVPDSYGEAVVNGRLWRWEFSYYIGPMFLRQDGEPMHRQPSEKNPVWKAFETWMKAKP